MHTHATIEITDTTVTILILVDGFLQFVARGGLKMLKEGHNPYFSRWFSAIYNLLKTSDFINSHNPYFSRWFSAILLCKKSTVHL